MSAPHISLNQQVLGVLEAARTQARTDHVEHRRGKLRLTVLEYRQAILAAAAETVSQLERQRDRIRLSPAQITLFKTWQTLAAELRVAPAGADAPVVLVSHVEAIALGRLLGDLAILALRADLLS